MLIKILKNNLWFDTYQDQQVLLPHEILRDYCVICAIHSFKFSSYQFTQINLKITDFLTMGASTDWFQLSFRSHWSRFLLQGHPFMESLRENKALLYSLLVSGGAIIALASGLLPDVAKQYKAARAEIDPVQDPRRRLLGNPGLRSTAVYKLSHPVWTELTAQWDCGRTNGLPVSCYPFLDRRMIEFALGLPVVPHCVGKSLARRAQLGRLPRAVVDRKKFVSLAGGGPAYGSSVCANVSTQFETNLFQSQALDCSLGNHLDSPALAGASQRARLACTWFDIWGTAPVF